MIFTIKGQVPGGKNSIKTTRIGKRFPTKRFEAWRDHAVLQVRQQSKNFLNEIPINKPANIEIYYNAGDNRRRDVPGIADAIFHVLERAGVVEDDTYLGGHGKECLFFNYGKRGEPGVEVIIWD